MLTVHGEDIRRFFPGFSGPVPDDGTDGVPRAARRRDGGVVLVRDAGAGVAQVELDYVTPRFRDFTPGEFVYRRSGCSGTAASGAS